MNRNNLRLRQIVDSIFPYGQVGDKAEGVALKRNGSIAVALKGEFLRKHIMAVAFLCGSIFVR